MPELPDVENFRRYLDATALHQTIAGVTVGSTKILRDISERDLTRALLGRRLEGSRRHGKHLFAALDDGAWLVMHFGMTGRLQYFERLADDPDYDRLRLDFDNGHHLAFINRRLLGRVGIAPDAEAFIAAQGLGPDALDPSLDAAAFVTLVAGRKGQLKAALMDQTLLAGIGNVYADEILFQARLHPKIPVRALNPESLAALFETIRQVLTTATERGAGSEDLMDRLPGSFLLPHRHEGAPCPRCGTPIASAKIQGRTTCFCPHCQPDPATAAA